MTTNLSRSDAKPALAVTASPGFTAWLEEQRVSLVFTTYQAGKVFWVGLDGRGALSIFERTLERVMGLVVAGEDLYLSTLFQLWRFRNLLENGANYQGYDRLYAPRESWVTGDLDIHDVALDGEGRVVFVATQFNCIATLDANHSFKALWRPPWVTQLVPEDRCHLNGMALRDDQIRYATCVSRSHLHDAWRDRRGDGGVVIDCQSNEVICEGLSMPHSPRWHPGKRALYVLESGTGNFGRVHAAGHFEALTFLPGYARGMALLDDYAVVGLSDRRENRTFQGLALEEALRQRGKDSICGLQIIDLVRDEVSHWLQLDGVVRELYDVAVIHGARRPMGIGFLGDEVRRTLAVAD